MEAHLRRLCHFVSRPLHTSHTQAFSSPSQSMLTQFSRSEHDQELDSLLVGPIPVGVNKFIFEADPPNTANIPATEILGVTVILLTCSYDSREFVRVGYYVNNEYTDEALINEPPAKPIVEKVRRNILAEKPRVTRFAIKWDSDESAPAEFPPEQPDVDAAEDDSATYGAEEEELEGEEEEGFPEGGEAAALGASVVAPKVPGDDHDMEGAEANGKDDDEESNAGSEDLEAESEDDEEEDLEDEEGEGEEEVEGEDVEMDDGQDAANGGSEQAPKQPQQPPQAHQPDVMVH
jgi:histone chaperone ASF1